jgi:hypothetical protein
MSVDLPLSESPQASAQCFPAEARKTRLREPGDVPCRMRRQSTRLSLDRRRVRVLPERVVADASASQLARRRLLSSELQRTPPPIVGIQWVLHRIPASKVQS